MIRTSPGPGRSYGARHSARTGARHGARRRLLTVAMLLAAAAVLLAGGCDRSLLPDALRGEGDQTRAMASVNGETIAYQDFQSTYLQFLTKWDRFIRNDPERKQALRELLLERMVTQTLLDQEAERLGIEVDETELRVRVQGMLGPNSEAGVDTLSLVEGQTLTEWSRSFKRRLIHERLIEQEVIDRIRVTPAELRQYYENHKAEFDRPERVKVRHIAVGSKAIYDRVFELLEEGREFVELVRTYSITPDRGDDGLLGYVEPGVMPPEFDEAIFSMDVGSVSSSEDPVKTEIGFHIFRVEDRKPAGQMDFRDAVPEIRETLIRRKQNEAYRQWLAGLRQRASIDINQRLLNSS